jgi:hypothetical protein
MSSRKVMLKEKMKKIQGERKIVRDREKGRK